MIEKTKKKNYKLAPFSHVHLKLYLAIILGQFTSGYAIQISGIAISVAQKHMNVSNLWLGLIGSGTLIGLACSVFVGKISDNIGRKKLLLANMYILALVSFFQLFITNLLITFIFRVIIGIMIAIDYTVGNTLLIEWLPTKASGRMQSYLVVYWTIGFIFAYFTSVWIPDFGSMTWRILMSSPAIFGLITALYRTFSKLPASPSWLATNGYHKEAQQVIKKHLGFKWGISKNRTKQGENKPVIKKKWTVIFSKEYINPTLVGSIFYAAQAFTFFGISIFLPVLIKHMGVSNTDLVGYLYNGCMFVGVCLGIRVFNQINRRTFLVVDFILAALCLLIMALWNSIPPTIELIVFSLFSIVLSAGLVMDYPYTSELFDTKVRGLGVGMVVTMSRLGAIAGTILLPITTGAVSVHFSMLICGIILFIAGSFCFFYAPETANQ